MRLKPLYVLSAVLLLILIGGCESIFKKKPAVIIHSKNASPLEILASREIQRYMYMRTGTFLEIVPDSSKKISKTRDRIIVANKNSSLVIPETNSQSMGLLMSLIDGDHYLLKTIKRGKTVTLLVTGGNESGVLYGAYRFAEKLGIRFYLDGDTIPDKKIPYSLPDLNEDSKPLFEVRGIQPFHDFPEGPDWWNLDDYRAVITQLPKLGMNFFGLHTYPEGGVGPEPAVWIGLKEDVNPDGTVKFSYPSRWFTTLEGGWGYGSKKTGDYLFGSSELFDVDDYGPDVMKGNTPMPKTPEASNEVFNRTGSLLKDSFGFAKLLGIKTCIGTETPLIIPKEVKAHLKELGKPDDSKSARELYEGMFTRLSLTCKPDYYWFWTPENWTWSGNTDAEMNATKNDLNAAIEAVKNVKAGFTLATCGWVLGPQNNRAMFDNFLPAEMPVSCINRNVGMSPVDPAFGKIKSRPKWAIPWLEDDPDLTSPQLWAGRMRSDAEDARKYGCNGLIGIHWRTKILGPNVSALANAAWDHKNYKSKPVVNGFIEGKAVTYGNIQIKGAPDPEIFRTARTDMTSLRLILPKGYYKIKLGFCENVFDSKGKRVFNVDIQGLTVLERFDIFAKAGGKNRAIAAEFNNIAVKDSILVIDFHPNIDSPVISSVEIAGEKGGVQINCGGPAHKGFIADDGKSLPRDLDTSDFYQDWAEAEFGAEASTEIAKIFSAKDGLLPRPADWVNGPGGLKPNNKLWDEVAKDYGFVTDFESLRQKVSGGGNLERFDYWMNNFNYMGLTAQLCCEWGKFSSLMESISGEKNAGTRAGRAKNEALPIYRMMVKLSSETMNTLLATVSTNGELGTVANWNQHLLPVILEETGKKLSDAMGEPLPKDALPAKTYSGESRLVVLSARTALLQGEPLRLKVIVISQSVAKKVEMYWKVMKGKEFSVVQFKNSGRGVYIVEIPKESINVTGIEYYVKAVDGEGKELIFPATAPLVNKTAIQLPWK